MVIRNGEWAWRDRSKAGMLAGSIEVNKIRHTGSLRWFQDNAEESNREIELRADYWCDSPLFRTEQHRLSRCDLARGWWPKVADRKNNTRTPSTRSLSRHMAARSRSERPRALTLTDDNGCLRHCAGCQQSTLKKPPDGQAR
ncbi:hypothetical protein T06_14752 [Trichinella sp. T6]|nr:hypothetical protein T06_14752 [Trichinella sp. T6]